MSGIGIYRGYANRPQLVWEHDLNKALAEGRAQNKLVLVDFNASWCGPCKQYRETVFPTPEFQQRAKDLILVDIDVDQQPVPSIKYRVYTLPDIRIIGTNGTEYGKVVGFNDEQLYSAIDTAKLLR